MRHEPLAHPEQLIRRVYAYVAYRIGNGAEAEDVTSDVFERALRYRSSYDRSKGEPIGWLIGIARNCIAEAARPPHAELVDEARDLELEARTAARVDVARAVAKLDPRDQELVALRYGADLTAKQIGRILDLKTNAVEVALHRALGKLRTELERDPTVREPRRPSPAPTTG
jgi:RNA polymerase sigma-70 factor (ECF subfamily)